MGNIVKLDKLIVLAVILLLAGSAFAMFARNNGNDSDKSAAGAETYEEMNSQMHPQSANDMSGHHGASPTKQQTTNSLQSYVGKPAPDFSLETLDGQTAGLSEYRGKSVILFFTEGAMCYPACWDQMAALSNDARFSSDQVAAFSIVVDDKSEWQKIIKKVPKLSTAKILFDTTKSASLSYGALNLPSSMHPGSFPGHTYFVIDKEGIVRFVLDDPNMGINNDLLASKITA